MMGFHQPQLIRALDAIDVPVENIIMLCEDKRETLKSQSLVSEQNLEQEPADEVEDKRQKVDEGKELSEQLRASYTPAVVTSYLLIVLETEPPALMAARARRLEDFWLGLESVLESRSPDSRLNDVVQLSYTVPSLRSSTDISDSEVSSNVVIFHQTFSMTDSLSLSILPAAEWNTHFRWHCPTHLQVCTMATATSALQREAKTHQCTTS